MTVKTLSGLQFGGTDPKLWTGVDDADFILSPAGMMAVEMQVNFYGPSEIGPLAVGLVGSHHDLTIQGSVIGTTGILLGDDAGLDFDNDLVVGASGTISASAAGVVIRGEGTVTNAGQIRAAGWYGIHHELVTDGVGQVTNSGLLMAGASALWVDGTADSSYRLVNSGTMIGGVSAYRGGDGTDTVINFGSMEGGLSLGEGDDRFNNIHGVLVGTAQGEGGNDIFVLGAGAETVDGGDGIDTVDYRNSAGVSLGLSGASGTGWAAGDSYKGIEQVVGSLTGSDTIVGNGSDNTLWGNGGSDTLTGAGGADRLLGGDGADHIGGGWGHDVLTGGLGNDRFYLGAKGEDSDIVKDFHNTSGDNDLFALAVFGLGGGFAAGAIAADTFRVRADNVAQDANDHFIFRTTDTTLWLDLDGKGGAGPILMADLQAGATVTAADLLLY